MSALAMTLMLLTAAPPHSIDLAIAQRTGPSSARLTLLKAEPRLQAICFDEVGYRPSELAAAREEAAAQTLWLYLGPRRIARGHAVSFESAPSPTGPCAVTAEAEFDSAVPLVASTDALWVTGQDLGSQPHLALPRGSLERARQALPEPLAQACQRATSTTARAAESGTYVNLVCALEGGEISTLVLLPKRGAGQIVLTDRGESGRLSLVDVLDPARSKSNTLLFAREVEGGRRLELWESDGRELKRLEAWAF